MDNALEKIKNEVFSRRPVLREIAEQYSGESLKSYVRNSWQVPASAPDEVFLACLRLALKEIYGPEISEQASQQLIFKPLVSTIDHLGIWNHPIYVNSSLIYSLHFNANELALVFPTESVSLNNTSSWSGCLLGHENGKLERYSFFPDKLKTLPVFSTPAVGNSNIEKIKARLPQRFLNVLSTLNFEEVMGFKNFSRQASKLSLSCWQAVFPTAPKLVYLPLESLIGDYLLKIFVNQEHFLSKLVLTETGRSLWRKYFADEHTFMFWTIDEKGRRAPNWEFDIRKEDLVRRLKNRQIYPSSPLCFAALLGAGLASVGGFTQTTWLTQTKEKLIELLKELPGNNLFLVEKIGLVPTKNFAESSLASLESEGGPADPSAADLLFMGNDYYPKFQKLAETMTLGRSLDLMLPTIYSVVVPKKNWVKNFQVSPGFRA